jgi:hypothetical protein
MRILRSELRLLGAAARALSFRPRAEPAEVEGVVRFAPATAEYQQLVVALIVMLLIEIPLAHLVLGMIIDDGPGWTGVRGALILGSVYLIVWLIGDLRLLRESPGVSVGQSIRVELGQRARGEVALSDVTAVQVLSGLDNEQSDAEATLERTVRITARPAPNVRVVLKRPVSMVGRFGIPRSGTRLDIHVDEPQALVSAIKRRMARV